MASGKKGKKTKGKTLALNDFLQGTPGSIAIQPIRKTNWADEVEDYDDLRKQVNVVLPTAPKASRDYEDISEKVPKEPPFCAYLSNLPYDIDEDEIADFFRNMRIANMRIPKADRGSESKTKGYGYIEFEDRESLLDALVMPDTMIKSRRMRIELSSNMDSNDKKQGKWSDMNRDRSDRSEPAGDWRSGPRQSEQSDDRRGGYNRDRDRDTGGGFTREGMREREERTFSRDNMRERDYGRDSNRDYGRDGGFGRDRDYGRDREGSRDFGRDSNRDSYRRDKDDDKPGGWREGERSNRDGDRDRGYNRGFRDADRNRFDDRERDNDRRGGYGGRRYEDRGRDRDGFSRGGGSRDDKDSDAPSSEPRERPRLMLAPRTKPVQSVPVNNGSVPSASIFGSAKPVDTSQREREIEARLAKEQDKPREDSRDRKHDDKIEKVDDADKKIERSDRSRPPRKIEDSPEKETKDDLPPRKNFDEKKPHPKTEQKSPDHTKHKVEKIEKPKREDKRDRHDKDMPKLTEPEPPNFAASNKFAFLQTDDNSD